MNNILRLEESNVLRRVSVIILLTVFAAACAKREPELIPKEKREAVAGILPPVATLGPESDVAVMLSGACNVGLWKHVYRGDNATAKDRLVVIDPCRTVTGKIINAVAEDDGDWHIRLKLDPQFESMLNAKNKSGQKGYLVVEPMCANKVTQKSTLDEGVCTHWSQDVYVAKTMKGRRVEVTGAFVNDTEHGWNEIHPVTKITMIQ
jgi:hypothetical protein